MGVRMSGSAAGNGLTSGTSFGNISGTAVSAFAWARWELYNTTTNAPAAMCGRWDGGGSTSQYMLVQEWSTGGVGFYSRNPSTTIATVGSTKIPLYKWVPCGATKDAATTKIYLAGKIDKIGADANSIQNVSASYKVGDSSITTPAKFTLAHVCVWNAVLTDEEMFRLHRGECLPPMIRPQNIVAYHVLENLQPERQGGGVLSVVAGRVNFEPFDLNQARGYAARGI